MNSNKSRTKTNKYKSAEKIILEKELKPLTKTAICNICGKRRRMSRDHVPLKALGNMGAVAVKSHYKRFNIKEIKVQNGIAYKTICVECNNKLGSLYDPYYKNFSDEVSKFADIVLKTQMILNDYSIEIDTIPSYLARSLIGHVLYKDTSEWSLYEGTKGICLKPSVFFTRFNPLKYMVLH